MESVKNIPGTYQQQFEQHARASHAQRDLRDFSSAQPLRVLCVSVDSALKLRPMLIFLTQRAPRRRDSQRKAGQNHRFNIDVNVGSEFGNLGFVNEAAVIVGHAVHAGLWSR